MAIFYKKESNNFDAAIDDFWQRAKNRQEDRPVSIWHAGKEVGLTFDGVEGGVGKYMAASTAAFDTIEIEEGFYEFRRLSKNEDVEPGSNQHLVDCFRGSPLGDSRWLLSQEEFDPTRVKLSLSFEGREEERKWRVIQSLAEKARDLGCTRIHLLGGGGYSGMSDLPCGSQKAEFLVVWGSGTPKELNLFMEEVTENLNIFFSSCVNAQQRKGKILVL